jgi:hypothetical protein
MELPRKLREKTEFAVLIVGALALLAGLSPLAQPFPAGSIQGAVSDTVGKPIAKALVTATNTNTGVQTRRQTNASGAYSISPIQPGPYNVEVVADGYQRLLQENVNVADNKVTGLSMKLTPGGAPVTVSVTNAPPTLDLAHSNIGGDSIANELYTTLPPADGTIQGKIIGPKGASIANALVTIVNSAARLYTHTSGPNCEGENPADPVPSSSGTAADRARRGGCSTPIAAPTSTTPAAWSGCMARTSALRSRRRRRALEVRQRGRHPLRQARLHALGARGDRRRWHVPHVPDRRARHLRQLAAPAPHPAPDQQGPAALEAARQREPGVRPHDRRLRLQACPMATGGSGTRTRPTARRSTSATRPTWCIGRRRASQRRTTAKARWSFSGTARTGLSTIRTAASPSSARTT